MATQYRPFIDWMKAVGIFLIVCGHVAARPINHLTPPIYPKQLGVAFFVFVLGFSLANERRPRAEVVFNRLFDMYLYAIPLALLISALAPIRHTLNLSNYLPFLLGANVIFDNFPANPTTWFVGTYLHILIVWALLVRFSVCGWMLVVAFAAEIVVRGVLATAGPFIAYMSLLNWTTMFLFGQWWGQRERAEAKPVQRTGPTGWMWLAGLAGLAIGWAWWMPALVERWSFPFARLHAGYLSLLATSACVSAAYLSYTYLFFQVARRFPTTGLVRFFARNTLFVFLVHMPVFYLLTWLMRSYHTAFVWTALINLAVCFVGLAVVSDLIQRAITPRKLRARVGDWIFARTAETSRDRAWDRQMQIRETLSKG